MSREIETKKKLKIRLCDGHILSYSSIENIFRNVLKCNMFNSNIKVFVGKNHAPEFFLELNCNINKQLSTDLLLNELPKYFTDYAITKEREENSISLSATLRSGGKSPSVNGICEPLSDPYQNTDNWFSLFIDNKEFDLEKLKSVVESTYNEAVGDIKSITIENFKSFKFECSDNKEYNLEYYQLETIK